MFHRVARQLAEIEACGVYCLRHRCDSSLEGGSCLDVTVINTSRALRGVASDRKDQLRRAGRGSTIHGTADDKSAARTQWPARGRGIDLLRAVAPRPKVCYGGERLSHCVIYFLRSRSRRKKAMHRSEAVMG
ncbi:hypothetical protein EVAR_60566_1 [Eumeta japonica]|uniref:Uncharacterized protein n=1 Tax=Eumeta variegata TaxID=151549 RepID=A0A4C1YE76_EUMVA|nr:hypothetical protein EVAR_60566_1 [Eumeta japonica]